MVEAGQTSLSLPSSADAAIQVRDAGVYLWTVNVTIANKQNPSGGFLWNDTNQIFSIQSWYRSSDGTTTIPTLSDSVSAARVRPLSYGTLSLSFIKNMAADSAIIINVSPGAPAGTPTNYDILSRGSTLTVQAL